MNLLYPYIVALSSHHQKNFLWQQIGEDAETHIMQRKLKLEVSIMFLALELWEYS